MTFKAEILQIFPIEGVFAEGKKSKYFTFTRSRILFDKNKKASIYYINIPLSQGIANEARYTIDREYDREDKKRWVITINGLKNHKSYVKMNWINAQKCRLIHNRYWILNDKYDWFRQAIVIAVITIISSAITYWITKNESFKEGYESGLKAGKEKAQQPIQLLQPIHKPKKE